METNDQEVIPYWVIRALAQSGPFEPFLWHKELCVLDCFLPEYDRDRRHVASPVYPEHFQDVLRAMDKSRRIVGVQFWNLWQLLELTGAFKTQDAEGNISALELWKHGMNLYEGYPRPNALSPERTEQIQKINKEVLELLAASPIQVPKRIWEEALPKNRLIL